MDIQRSNKIAGEWSKLSKLFAALGDENRQKMLLIFDPDEELTVKQLSELFPLSATACAHHIKTLRESGALKARKQGKETFLSVDREFIQIALKNTLDHIQNN